MSASIITFETEYISEQINNINKAKSLVEEAESILKKTSQHRNWQCREVTEINNGLNDISRKVNRIESGITDTANVLDKALAAFTELEDRAVNNADKLSSDLQNNYGFKGSNYGSNAMTIVPRTIIGSSILAAIDNVVVNKPTIIRKCPPSNPNQFSLFCTEVGNFVGNFFQNIGKGVETIINKIGEIFHNVGDEISNRLDHAFERWANLNDRKTDAEIRRNESINENVVEYEHEKTEQTKSNNEAFGKVIDVVSSVISFFTGSK